MKSVKRFSVGVFGGACNPLLDSRISSGIRLSAQALKHFTAPLQLMACCSPLSPTPKFKAFCRQFKTRPPAAGIFLLPAAFLLTTYCLAQETSISGKAPHFAGRRILVQAEEDGLSKARMSIQSGEIDGNGTFRLAWTATSTREYRLVIGSVYALFYAHPGEALTAELAPPDSSVFRRFDQAETELEFPQASGDNLNLLIRSFNRDYASFIQLHLFDFAAPQFRGSEAYRAKLASAEDAPDMASGMNVTGQDSTNASVVPFSSLVEDFAASMHQKYGGKYADTYFRDYVAFSLAELELMSGVRRSILYSDYFMSRRPQPGHPAFMKFFNLFYDSFFKDQPSSIRKEIIRCVNAERSLSCLSGLMASDSLCRSAYLRELVLIKALRDSYHDPEFSQASIESTLQKWSASGTDSESAAIAGRTLTELRRGRKGSEIGSFTLLDADNERWTWNGPTGQFTYFYFTAGWCTTCRKDLVILENLRKEYGRWVDFVVICMDETHDDFLRFIQTARDQKSRFLYSGNDPEMRLRFTMRSLPHAVLVSPEGTVVWDYTRRPGEGIQMEFEKIARKSARTGSGTWKD